MEKRLPKSIRKYIRKEKACIRKQVFSIEEQEKLIDNLYKRFLKEPSKESKSKETKEIKKRETKKELKKKE